MSQRPQPGGAPVAEKRVDIAYTDDGQFDTLARYADLAGTELAASTQYTWDNRSRLVSLRHAQGTATLAGYDWAFDAAGRLTSFASLLDGTATYAYDPTDQLVGATYSTTATQPPAQAAETYAYDGNGNRAGAGFVTDPNNHTVADGTYTYEYDGEGNRIRRVETATGIVTEYAWDHRNRLTRVTEKPSAASAPSQFVEFAYDALDRRVSKSIDADADGMFDRVTYFVVDGLRSDNDGAGDHILLTLTDPDGPSGPAAAAVDHRYLHGPAVDQILADEQVDNGSSPPTSRVLWTLTDHQNTVRDLAERDAATGVTTVVTHRQFDSFGEMTAAVNPSEPSASVVDTLFGYTGREFDPETGLAYVRARYYDPALAQFVNEDPQGFAAGDANIRRYVGNHATYAVDPSGLEERRADRNGPSIGPPTLGPLEQMWHNIVGRLTNGQHLIEDPATYGEPDPFWWTVGQLYHGPGLVVFNSGRNVARTPLDAVELCQNPSKKLEDTVHGLYAVLNGDFPCPDHRRLEFLSEQALTFYLSRRIATPTFRKLGSLELHVVEDASRVGYVIQENGLLAAATNRSLVVSTVNSSPTLLTNLSTGMATVTPPLLSIAGSANGPSNPDGIESPTHGPPKAPASSVALEIEQRAIDLELPDQLKSKGGVGTSEVVAPNTKQPLSTSIGDLRAAGRKDAHHVIQDAAVRDLPGYDTNLAPGVQLHGPSTARGTPHYNATQVQRELGGGTYAAERRIGYKSLRRAGQSEVEARQIIEEADVYFRSIGVTPSTPTRIPGNRN